MSEAVTIPEPVIEQERWPEPPRLLVEWSSPWEEFKTAIRPALKKSPKALVFLAQAVNFVTHVCSASRKTSRFASVTTSILFCQEGPRRQAQLAHGSGSRIHRFSSFSKAATDASTSSNAGGGPMIMPAIRA